MTKSTILRAVAVGLVLASAHPAAAYVRCQAEAALYSSRGDKPTVMVFVNEGSRPMRTYWLDYQGRRKYYATVQPGGSYEQSTFASHPWVITDANDNCLMVTFAEDGRTTVSVSP